MYYIPTLQRVVSTQWSHENEHHNMALPCKVSKTAAYLGATLQHLFPHHLDTNSSCGHGGKHVKISQTSTIRMTLSLPVFAAHVFLRFELDALTSPVSWSSNSWRPGSEVLRASYEYLGKTREDGGGHHIKLISLECQTQFRSGKMLAIFQALFVCPMAGAVCVFYPRLAKTDLPLCMCFPPREFCKG